MLPLHQRRVLFQIFASCGSWNRTNGLLVQSQASLPTATIPHRVCQQTVRVSHPIAQVQSLRSRLLAGPNHDIDLSSQEGRAGLEPARWYLTGTCSAAELPTQFHRSGRRGSRTLKAEARPGSSGVPSPVGLPFRYESCGSRNRTCDKAVNSRPPVPTQDPPHYISQDGWI